MFNAALTARNVTDWTAILKLPKPLAEAIAIYEESDYVMAPPAVFNTDGLTRENIGTEIEKFSQRMAAAATFEGAKQTAREQLAVDLIHAAADAVPFLVNQFRPEFAKGTADYVDAVAQLPTTFNGDLIADAPEAVQGAYRTAVEAASTIRRVDSWLASLGNLPTHGSHTPDPHCRVLAPKTREELAAVMTSPKLSKSEERLHGLYLVAARAGVEFEMHTPKQATELRKEIDSIPIVRKPLKFARIGR
jgi:hypothetical protein